jgi:hypothetical protein
MPLRPLTVAELKLIDGDLAIQGRRIDGTDDPTRRRTHSVVQERYQAFNWLLGSHPLYSEVPMDT